MVPAPGRRHSRPVTPGAANQTTTAARVIVTTTHGDYPVWIGRGLLGRLDELLPALPGAEAAAVVFAPPVAHLADRVGRIRDLLVARGPIYETAGDVAIDTDRLTLEQTAVEVLEWYRRRVGAMAGR